MIRKSTLLLGVFLALVVGVAIIVAINIKEKKSRATLLSRTQNAISDYRSGAEPNINFSAITPFSWERMYVFGPYSVCKHINEIIGVNWFGCKSTGIEYHENGSLFVFVKNGDVVQHMLYDGVFTDTIQEEGFSFQDALFTIDDKGIINWVDER